MNTNEFHADIIIAGGGTTACVVACRLAESFPDLTILMVENGVDIQGDERTKRPLDGMFRYVEGSVDINFVESKPSIHLNGRAPVVPVGNILGGSSSINFMMYNNAVASDFDDWEQPGWSFSDLLPLIKKTETFDVPCIPLGDHGNKGVMQVSMGGYEVPYAESFFNAFEKVKQVPKVSDLTDYHTGHGCGYFPKLISKHNGYRSNVAQSYLYDRGHGILGSNVKIVTARTVQRILFQGTKAIGVEIYNSPSDSTKMYARRMVLVCAGAFGSPAILERSGIGGRDLLGNLGIDLKVDLPGVGEGYQDHELTICSYHVTEETDTLDDYPRGIHAVKSQADDIWRRNGSGIAATNGMDFGYKIRPTEEDIQEMGETFARHWRSVTNGKADKPLYSGPFVPYFMGPHERPKTGKYISMGAFSNYPASRGSVHITSVDPKAPPLFDSGLLSDPADLPVHVWAYKMQREVVRRLPFVVGEHQGSHPQFPKGSMAACSPKSKRTDAAENIKYTAEDDSAIEEWVRRTAGTAFHSMSTCPMKPREEGGVVDPRLNVYGIQNLKVADLSICPVNLGTNTTTVALIIGEKCAQLLDEELRATTVRM